MAAIAVHQGALAPIPRAGVVPLAPALGALWLVTFEGGAVSESLARAGSFLHGMFHDGRHLLGVPCH